MTGHIEVLQTAYISKTVTSRRLHGANHLASNSPLECVVTEQVAAAKAASQH
ncbi:hypothetical protein [Snodgrassella gandavensis]|uniref:hypothetical protein n=1 Tax=Snodgrassella gandavensis TaxID=2946698 RepID=UPI001EF5B014|nr:hypothetical protein [Snodgrassella gandavensis]